MNFLKKYSTVLAVVAAVGLGTGINYWNKMGNVPSCVKSPGCQADNLGTLTTKKYGYPVTYKEVVSFEPNDKSNYAIVSTEPNNVSWPNIIINAIFWYALLVLGINIYKSQKNKR